MDTIEYWESWQLEWVDLYIENRTNKTQKEICEIIGKNLNSLKIKISRRRKEIEFEKTSLTDSQYLFYLSNRFSYTTYDMARKLRISQNYLVELIDEDFDSLECSDFFMDNYLDRELTEDEYNIFAKLYFDKYSIESISHILNRDINFIKGLVNELENC